MRIQVVCLALVTCAAGTASAQLYRWTDEKGRVHITDTAPPASARSVQKKKPGEVAGIEAQRPFELEQAMKDFPVTLYTSPNCKEGCDAARALLNRRAVPFREVQVWEEKSNEELKRVSGGNQVPTLIIGRSVHRGFEPGAYEALLDSARYPRAGLLPQRAQAAPRAPEGYTNEVPSSPPVAQPVKPEPEAPRGPYAPRPSK